LGWGFEIGVSKDGGFYLMIVRGSSTFEGAARGRREMDGYTCRKIYHPSLTIRTSG
jgi:hypothetical protein